MIRYFEAFAGLGAFRSAFEKVGGFECVGWCEIDRYAQKAYRALYDTGGENFYEDITKIDYGGMPDFDLLVGGPCCQSFSVAGQRRAFEDDRGTLFFDFIRILKVKRPKYFIAKTYPTCWAYRRGNASRQSLKRFQNWGIACAGVCLTLPALEYRSPEKGYSLSDILEKDVPAKYYLSDEAMRKMEQQENLNN